MMAFARQSILAGAIGALAFLGAAPASAGVIYDTITGQTENPGSLSPVVRDSLSPVAAANRGPLGDRFIAATTDVLTSVTLQLRNVNTAPSAGGVSVYLVQDVGGLPATASNTTLSGKVLLGHINDNQVTPLGGGTGASLPINAFQNVTLSTNAAITGGQAYWIELVDDADPRNNGTVGTATFLKWGINSPNASEIGLPFGNIYSVANSTNTGFSAFTATNDVISDVTLTNPVSFPAGEVFELQLVTGVPATGVPEPASVAALCVGLLGLIAMRSRQNRKSIV